MEAHARQAKDLPQPEQEEDPPLSIWFWIVPLLFLLAFVAVFAIHRRAGVPHPPTPNSLSALPELGVVQFYSGKPTLTADGQAALDRAADAMRGNPNVRLRLEGYETPRAKSRKKDRRIDPLGIQRSLAVEQYLDAKGIERSRLTGGKFIRAAESPSAFAGRNADSRRAELYAQ